MLSTFTVTNLGESGQGSLRQAIVEANDRQGRDTIRFSRGLQGTIALTSELAITDDLIIRGPGVSTLTVSGSDVTRVFTVLPADLAGNPFVTPTQAQLDRAPEVTIQGLAIADGRGTDAPGNATGSGFAFGGAVYNLGGAVHLNQVHLADNVAFGAVAAGGAVANEFGGTLTVSRSRFEGNTAEGLAVGVGGAITSDLGMTADGGTTRQPNVTMDRSRFLGNTARSLSGHDDTAPFTGFAGGGAVLNVTGAMTISRSHFEGNAAEGGTGAATSGGPALGGAVFSGNASPFGEAQSTLDISRSTFQGNTATGGDGSAGVPGGVASGGAVAVSNGSIAELNRNTIVGNTVVGGTGGADADGDIAFGGGVSGLGGATLTLLRNAINGNTADGGPGSASGADASGRGGGLALHSVSLAGIAPESATATVDGDLYQGNRALGGIGGGLYNEGRLSLSRAVVESNRAVGRPGVVVVVGPALPTAGGAVGGGVANFGVLDVSRGRFSDNEALGGDGATGFFPGGALGGALSNYTTDFGTATATIANSQFNNNRALAGDGGIGDFAAIAGGGAITNDSTMEIVGSSFRGNRAVAGDNSSSPFHNGHALGGAIGSGSLTPSVDPSFPGGDLIVRRSDFVNNEAVGGNNNTINLTGIPPADTPNNGYGGAILAFQGSIQVLDSNVSRNRAVGGRSEVDQGGSLGIGGGMFLFNFLSLTDTSGLEAIVRGGSITRNAAVGGDGPVGGDGIGGGLAVGTFGSLFATGEGGNAAIEGVLLGFNRAEGGNGDSGAGGDGLGGGLANLSGNATTVSRSTFLANRALGGGGLTGGNGEGGGIFNQADAAIELTRSLVFFNLAAGGPGSVGGDGLGVGGGIVNASGGVFEIDPFSLRLTRLNRATDQDDNVHGDLTVI